MRNRLVIALLAVAGMILAACGSNGAGDSSSGDAPDKYVLVSIMPMSGNSAAFGEMSQAGVQLALEDIEKAGGINGAKMEVLFEDNELLPEGQIKAYQRTASKKPVAIISAGSSMVLAIAQLTKDDGVLLANIGAQSPALLSPDLPTVYSFIPTSAAEAGRLADRLINDEHITKMAVLSSDDDYGKDTSAAFEAAYKDVGGEVVAHEIHEVGSTNMRTQLTKIKSSGAQGILYVSNVAEVGYGVAQSAELGINLPRFGFTYALSPDNFEIAGAAMNGMKGVAVSFKDNNDLASAFATRFEAKTGNAPNVVAATSYDTTMILADGLRKVGNDRAALLKWVAGVKDHAGVLGNISMTPQRQVDFPLNEFQIVDGKVVDWP